LPAGGVDRLLVEKQIDVRGVLRKPTKATLAEPVLRADVFSCHGL
jgi:hypothetical protein